MTDLPDLKALREAAEKWKAATKIWSLDPATDAIATMKIGENMLFAGIDYIATLQNYAAAQGARITALEEELGKLRSTAALLQQNAEGCAVNHHGEDFAIHGLPGWLADTRASIDRASTLLKDS